VDTIVKYVGIRHEGVCMVRRTELRKGVVIRMNEMTSVPAFDWGDAGDHDGAGQLALAILSDHLRDDLKAIRFRSAYRDAVIARLPQATWELPAEEVERVVKELRVG